MEIKNVWFVIQDNGDGSSSAQPFPSKEDAVAFAKQLEGVCDVNTDCFKLKFDNGKYYVRTWDFTWKELE